MRMIEPAAQLRAQGLKPTPQRLAIFGHLAATKAHPSAQTIYKSLQETYPTLSFNTVYTTLDTLETAGLIQRFDPRQGAFRYDGNPDPHAHVACLNCGRVDDVEAAAALDLAKAAREVSQRTHYRLAPRYDVIFYGVCPLCQADTRREPALPTVGAGKTNRKSNRNQEGELK